MNLKDYAHFLCPLDENVLVLLLDPEEDDFCLPADSKWHFEMSMFETSHAFAVWEDVPQPLILIDKRIFNEGWFTADHLFVIIAHELGHIQNQSLDESLASMHGLRLLHIHGLTSAANLLEMIIEESKIKPSE